MDTLIIDNNNCKEKLQNIDKTVKYIKVNGYIDISLLCTLLEDVKPTIKLIDFKYINELNEEFKRRNTFQGFNKSILNMVKKIIKENVTTKDYVVDMTIGNGFDTLYLANTSKHVFGFDIQKLAINNTTNLLENNNIKNYTLFLSSHVNINTLLHDYTNNIKLILFNLGYLPCGDKTITTNHLTTLNALINSLNMLSKDGLILIVFYPHPEGKKEEQVVLNYLNNNNINYKTYRNTPNKEAPYLVVITKN